MSAAAYPDPATLLPHGDHARFVCRVLEAGEGSIVCTGRVPAESAFVQDGKVATFVALEFAAQCAAALETLQRAGEGGPAEARVGYVVGAREVELHGADFDAADELRGTVEMAGSAPPLTVYRVSVRAGGETVARATLSTYIAD